jgi:hypothetical protein
MMQIVVRNVAPAAAYDPTALVAALPTAYGASQPSPIVPAVAYNAAFGTNDTDIYAHVATGSIAQPNLEFSTSANGGITLTGLNLITSGGTVVAGGQIVGNAIPGSGTGYDPSSPPIVAFNNVVNGVDCLPTVKVNGVDVPGISASATAVVDPGTRQVTAVNVSTYGSGYTCAPTVTFQNPTGTSGVGAQVAVVSQKSNFHSYPVLAKAEQELFDNRGRYNSTGGVELPLVSGVVQTTVPLNYIDSATEIIGDDEVQIWKLVDNGLWTNSIHFNMVDVQLINRVGWDGTVKAPASNEVGWKDTLRLNPLEDVIVAMRAKRPSVPFGLPQSKRLLDPSKPVGTTGAAASGLGFTVATGVTPLPAVSNVQDNFDNEFAWGSAILGHSENDLLRPVIFRPTVAVPDAPTNLTDPLGNGTLTWTDLTPAGNAATIANPKNEIGFRLLQGIVDGNGNVGPLTPVMNAAGLPVTVPANTTRWTAPAQAPDTAYAVVAYNVAGDSPPSNTFAEKLPVAPTTFIAGPVLFNSVTLSWSGASTSNQLQVWRSVAGAAPAMIASLPGTASGFVDNAANAALYKYTPAVSTQVTYTYQIKAVNALAPTPTGAAISTTLSVTTPAIPVTAPTIVSATPNTAGTSVLLSWTDNANNETAYWVDVTNATTGSSNPQLVIARNANQGTAVNGTLNSTIATLPGNVYVLKVTAVNVTGGATSTSTPATTTVDLSAPAAPATPTGLSLGAQTATRAPLSWTAVAGATSYVVQVSTNGSAYASLPQTTNTSTNAAIAAGNSYSFQVLAQATKYGMTTSSLTASNAVTVSTPPAASTPPVAAAGGTGTKQITVTWTNPSKNITGFTVQRRLGGGAWVAMATQPTPTQSGTAYSFTDTVPAAGNYSYRVTAVSAGGTSGPVTSNTVTAP